MAPAATPLSQDGVPTPEGQSSSFGGPVPLRNNNVAPQVLPPPPSPPPLSPQQAFLKVLQDMLELEEAGESVHWPLGFNAATVRQMLSEGELPPAPDVHGGNA